MNDSDEPFQALVPDLTVVMYVRIMHDTTLVLVEVDICVNRVIISYLTIL